MVRVALSEQPVTICPAGDIDGSMSITVDEVMSAVNAALLGCPYPPPTGLVIQRNRSGSRP
jgi:hypothetical protein